MIMRMVAAENEANALWLELAAAAENHSEAFERVKKAAAEELDRVKKAAAEELQEAVRRSNAVWW